VDEAERMVHTAIDAGITFFDNCWEYYNGRTEDWLGRALKGRRDKVFLMTKVCTHGRDRKVAMRQLEESLRRLRTDHLDLWQVHECVYFDDPDLHFARGASSRPWTRRRRTVRSASWASPATNTRRST
jgi:aryl-alcohol dehydrogenase-like predicted oxidoreductase